MDSIKKLGLLTIAKEPTICHTSLSTIGAFQNNKREYKNPNRKKRIMGVKELSKQNHTPIIQHMDRVITPKLY